jgi:hypothetical protein
MIFETILKQILVRISIGFKTIIDSVKSLILNLLVNRRRQCFVTLKIKQGDCSVPVYVELIKAKLYLKWLNPQEPTVYLLSKKNADKIVLNYKNEVPKYNLNNWKSLKSFFQTIVP